MKINDTYAVEAFNDRGYMVVQTKYTKKRKDGTPLPEPIERQVPIAYCSTVENALKFLVDYEIIGTGFQDLQEINDKIKELKQLITDFCRPTLKAELDVEYADKVKRDGRRSIEQEDEDVPDDDNAINSHSGDNGDKPLPKYMTMTRKRGRKKK